LKDASFLKDEMCFVSGRPVELAGPGNQILLAQNLVVLFPKNTVVETKSLVSMNFLYSGNQDRGGK
jgi:hypothetical protein